MTEDRPHPTAEFLNETANGKVAYSPSTEKDTGRHWLFTWRRDGFAFHFVVHDRDGVAGTEVYARDIRWIDQFIAKIEFEYVDSPCEEVQRLVSERVAIREEPLAIAEMKTTCTGCTARYEVRVMPKLDLSIGGRPGQRVFQETCPECDGALTEKQTYEPRRYPVYPEDTSELGESEVWEHSRRTPRT